jgi:flagellar FliJ protein
MAKKFAFSLQKLLDFKEQLLEVERGILAEMNAQLQKMNDELSALYREHAEKTVELREKCAVGITPMEMAIHKNYLTSIEQAIRDKMRQIELQQEAVDRQLEKVREAKMEISSIEKLRERKLEEYNYLDNKAQEQFVEEFVTTAKAMSEIAG